MTHPTQQAHTGHRAVIQDALEDWWITTDPCEPFTPAAVATQVDMYLAASGYTITLDTPRNHHMPTRRAITGAFLIALLGAASTLGAATHGDWGWATAGLLGTGVLTREAIRALNTRRRSRT